MQDIEDLFGVPVIQTFGMTEAGPLITSNSLPPGTRRPGSVGVSCGPRIRILAPDGADLPCGATGEIVIQGENVIAGYEDAPEANATSFRNGWFHTGDTGYIDDEGFVFLTGRLKEMINRGGENITPQEIDDVLLRHPEVAQAASFSIKHRTLGEDVAAAVVLRSPNAVGESDIRGFALRHLADFKVPRMVIFLDRMPRDPIGKISRMSLAVLAEAERAANRAADSGGGLGESAAKMLSDAPTEARRRLLSEPLRRDELPVRAKYVAPVSELECRLAAIWQDILNVDIVGLLDDYFDLGGDSLMAAELFVELERNFGVRLATSDVLEHPSVAKLAALLGGETQIYANRCLIPLQTEGASPPLFFIHDMSGGVMSYRHLLRRLGTRRKVFGLQYPGQSQNSTSIMSFPEMAAVYVEAIHSVWPHGPYYVVGYSMGAQIAFETASQLTAAGGAVRLLALIDGPTRKGKVSGLQREARKLSRELFYLADVSVDRWPGYLLGLVRRDLLRHWKKWRQRRRQDAPPKFEVLIDAESARYLPPNYGGPIKVLRSTEGLEYFNRKYLGWDKYASGPIEVFDISAEHATIMTEPRVALVTAYLEDAIRQAESTGPIAQPTSGPQQSAAQRREGASGVGTWPPHPSGRKF